MNVCLIGDGLISLTLAKALINKKIKVFVYYKNKKENTNSIRTIGISANNLSFIKKEIINIKKNLIWDIKQIEIYNDKKNKEKILDFKQNKKRLFSIIKSKVLYNLLIKNLKKNGNFKKVLIKNKSFYTKILNNKKFDLVINCEANNNISKTYFYKKIFKNYNSTAYATVINHEKIKNVKAVQIFTKYGPLAFLPISEFQTSVIFSIKNNNSILKEVQLNKLIIENNIKYKIKSFNKFEAFKLSSKILRNYYYKNILSFGDQLHQIHPLAGQGFNMTIRDIKILLDLIKYREDLGLKIDQSIYQDFEKKTKHLNFLFSSGNDIIYEIFNHNNNYLKIYSEKLFKYINKNQRLKNLAIKYANTGLAS